MEIESCMHVSVYVVGHNDFFYLLSFQSFQIVALISFQDWIIDSSFFLTLTCFFQVPNLDTVLFGYLTYSSQLVRRLVFHCKQTL